MPKSHIMKTVRKLKTKTTKETRTAISLFTGAGGMDVGFVNAGFKVLWANDFDPDACESYRANHNVEIVCGDINKHLDSLKTFKGVDCIFGGPPCQGFSVAGKMELDDPRSTLVNSFMNAVEIVSPRAFVMENVKSLATLSKFEFIRAGLIKKAVKMGYHVEMVILNASEYGVPQKRERMFLIGFKKKAYNGYLREHLKSFKTKSPRLRDVLLELGTAGSPGNTRTCSAKVTIAKNPVLRRSPYAGMLFNGQGRPLDPDGYASTLAATMGGNRTPIVDERHCYLGKPSWVEKYHKHLMKGGEPYSVDAAPQYLRRLTVDEVIALQTFPKDYKLVGRQSSLYRQLGNAVPPRLAQAVAEATMAILNGNLSDIDYAKKGETLALAF